MILSLSYNCKCWHTFVYKNSLFSLRRASLRIGTPLAGHSCSVELPNYTVRAYPFPPPPMSPTSRVGPATPYHFASQTNLKDPAPKKGQYTHSPSGIQPQLGQSAVY